MARPRVGATTVISESGWTKGIVRDTHRTAIPDGGLYDATDALLHKPGVAQKRGGTSYAGPALTGSTYVDRVSYAEFPAGAKLCAIGNNNHLYTITEATTTDVGATANGFVGGPAGIDSMKLFSGGTKNLLVIPAADGVTAPKTYDGAATIANLGGTPPAARYLAIHGPRIVFANGRVGGLDYPARVWFSPTPDPEATWDTANAWIDVGHPVTGLASLQNMLLVFSNRHLQRYMGPPPPEIGKLEPVGSIGAPDARAIVVQDGTCIFANPSGVYLTNGVGFQSLTRDGGIETLWRETLSDYGPTALLSMGIYARTFLYVMYRNPSGEFPFLYALMCHLPTLAWWRTTGVTAFQFAAASGIGDELYYAATGTNRVVELSGMFLPTAANKNDADGTAVGMALYLRPFGTGTGVKHFTDMHVTMDMRDAAADNPLLTCATAPGINAETYTDHVNLSETAAASRSYRVTVGARDQVVSPRFTVPQASSKCEVYAVEVEQRPLSLAEGGTT